ncbi:MAG: ammonium transporter [Verrucomicrobiota bacterium]
MKSNLTYFIAIAVLIALPLATHISYAQEIPQATRVMQAEEAIKAQKETQDLQAKNQAQDAQLINIQSEIQKIQRDYIELQKSLQDSGVNPSLKNDLKKIKDIDSLSKKLSNIQKENARLKDQLEVVAEDNKKQNIESKAKAEGGWLGASWVWVLIAGFMVMLMQAGFALVETGFTRAKNAAHTMMMNLLDYGIGMLVFWAFGFAIMFGGASNIDSIALGEEINSSVEFSIGGQTYSILGNAGYFLAGSNVYTGGVFTLFLFQMVFAATANTICTGTLTERWKIQAFCLTSVIVTGFIYPIFGHWVWGGGWLSTLGYVDFAGSTVVHMTGGVIALVGAYVVGPRVGKFNKDGSSNPIPGHNIPMAFLGTFLLAFGWFGFNAGSSLDGTDMHIGIIATNTALASAAGMIIATLTSKFKFGMPDPSFACNGLLAGLVGITAPCAYVDAWAAVFIGAVAGVIVVFSAIFIEEVLKLDDPVGAISVHGTCGAWGGLALGLFANGSNGVTGLFFGDPNQLFIQIIGIIVCLIFVGLSGYAAFWTVERIVGNRASDQQQKEGLDLAEMGIEAYSIESENNQLLNTVATTQQEEAMT